MDIGHKWSSIICYVKQRNSSSSSNWEFALGFHQDPFRMVLTCRCDPSRLFWVIIERGCIKQSIGSEEKNRGHFEKAHEYDAWRSSMIDQEALWDACSFIQ